MKLKLKGLSLKKIAKFAGKVAQGAAAVSNPAGFLLSKLKTSGQSPKSVAKPVDATSRTDLAVRAKYAPVAKKQLGLSDANRELLGLGSNADTRKYGTETAKKMAAKKSTLAKASAKIAGPTAKQQTLYAQWLALGKPGSWVEFAAEYGG